MLEKGAFTPDILAFQQNMRRMEYERYLHDLVSLNEEAFINAPDV